MTPTAGCVYNFTFKSGYNVFNGIYKVSKIMTFAEYVDDGGDIDNDFFSPNDKSEELNNELPNVQTSKILKLSHPSDDDLDPIFVPMYYLECTPDFNVKDMTFIAGGHFVLASGGCSAFAVRIPFTASTDSLLL